MKEKKSVAERFDAFFNGKGFYIVLFVCAAVIGVSAWTLLFSDSAENDVRIMQDGTGNEDGLSAFIGGENEDDKVEVFSDAAEPAIPDTDTVTIAETAPDPVPEASASRTAEPEPEASETVSEIETAETEPAEPGIDELVFVWPVSGEISMAYSVDYPVYSKTMADWRTHDGLDIESTMGERVLAAASGTVTEVTSDEMYGTTVVIDHGAGLCSVYSNLAATPAVKAGDAVTMASVIGSVGDTAIAESAEPAHLHFEMTLDGVSVDPSDYLPEH